LKSLRLRYNTELLGIAALQQSVATGDRPLPDNRRLQVQNFEMAVFTVAAILAQVLLATALVA
jgi:hypothetical protein